MNVRLGPQTAEMNVNKEKLILSNFGPTSMNRKNEKVGLSYDLDKVGLEPECHYGRTFGDY